MGKALAVILVAVISGLAVYWIAAPRFLTPVSGPASAPSPAQSATSQSPNPSSSPSSPTAFPANNSISSSSVLPDNSSSGINGSSLAPPRTAEQRAADELEAKRAPYYAWARSKAKDLLADISSAKDDRATLLLYATQNGDKVVTDLLRQVVMDYAARYGFNHVRYFVPNSPGSVERYRFEAESNLDSNGNWSTFRK